jgi:hypothetical protein
MINITRQGDKEFSVTVQEGGTSKAYTVTLEHSYYQTLTQGTITEEELIERSFAFLLEREPKESILSQFNLKIITRYFPEFEEEIRNAL